jgi:hypothetical protein
LAGESACPTGFSKASNADAARDLKDVVGSASNGVKSDAYEIEVTDYH